MDKKIFELKKTSNTFTTNHNSSCGGQDSQSDQTLSLSKKKGCYIWKGNKGQSFNT